MNCCGNRLLRAVAAAVLVVTVMSCSLTKHVPEGKMLLDNVKINVTDSKAVTDKDLVGYLRQTPNHKVLGGLRLQLMTYNLSGRDSTGRFNRWIRRVGQAPVIYDSALTDASAVQLRRAVQNLGYLHAEVDTKRDLKPEKKRAKVTYDITLHDPYYIRSLTYNIPDDTLRSIILADTSQLLLKEGHLFDRNVLEAERQQITATLRNRGYFAFNKDNINYTADTAANSLAVDVTLNVNEPRPNNRLPGYTEHSPFYVRHVTVVTNYDPVTMRDETQYVARDTAIFNGLEIHYDDFYLRKRVIDESCYVRPGEPFSADATQRTYNAFGRLGILKFVNINYRPVGNVDGKNWVDAYVLMSRGQSQNVSLSLEGTNSEGDLGFGVGLGYQHRNIAKGSEVLTAKVGVAYEAISGNFSDLINKHYTEYTADVGITYPKFKAPFLSKSFKDRIRANTEFSTNFSLQQRPEFTRLIVGAAWKYHWSEQQARTRQTLDLLDINYVYLPESKTGFIDDITNPLLRYSYEDHFIMRLGYIYYHTNKEQAANPLYRKFQSNVYTLRFAAETAGNTLFAFSKITGQKKKDGAYRIFNINYSQYVKAEIDYTLRHKFNTRHGIAFHAGFGIGIPYGNSTILPFEKRFYGGGANGVRGWNVRSLGPGRYVSSNEQSDFINQCGDIRLDLSLEYRAKLFWVFELGVFVDAGNIWTIRDYDNQPGGKFKFNSFYKEIAMAYGVGLRLDFDYFVLRFDLGMKAYNPAEGAVRWPIFSPNWKRDYALHFAVGYPF